MELLLCEHCGQMTDRFATIRKSVLERWTEFYHPVDSLYLDSETTKHHLCPSCWDKFAGMIDSFLDAEEPSQ